MAMNLPGCAEQVYQGRGGMAPCQRRGTVYAAKKAYGITKKGWWCKQHSPAEVAKRQAAWEARFAADRARENRHYARREAMDELMEWARAHKGALPAAALRFVTEYERNI